MHHPNAKAPRTADGIPWLFRATFIGMGLIAIAAGLSAWRNGPLWERSYNPYLGRITTGTPVAMAGIGLVFVAIGFLPWGAIARKLGNKRTGASRGHF